MLHALQMNAHRCHILPEILRAGILGAGAAAVLSGETKHEHRPTAAFGQVIEREPLFLWCMTSVMLLATVMVVMVMVVVMPVVFVAVMVAVMPMVVVAAMSTVRRHNIKVLAIAGHTHLAGRISGTSCR